VKVEGPASHETKDTDSKGSVGRHLGLAAAHGKSKTTYDETKRKLRQKLAMDIAPWKAPKPGVTPSMNVEARKPAMAPAGPALTPEQQGFRNLTTQQRGQFAQSIGQDVKDRTAQARKVWERTGHNVGLGSTYQLPETAKSAVSNATLGRMAGQNKTLTGAVSAGGAPLAFMKGVVKPLAGQVGVEGAGQLIGGPSDPSNETALNDVQNYSGTARSAENWNAAGTALNAGANAVWAATSPKVTGALNATNKIWEDPTSLGNYASAAGYIPGAMVGGPAGALASHANTVLTSGLENSLTDAGKQRTVDAWQNQTLADQGRSGFGKAVGTVKNIASGALGDTAASGAAIGRLVGGDNVKNVEKGFLSDAESQKLYHQRLDQYKQLYSKSFGGNAGVVEDMADRAARRDADAMWRSRMQGDSKPVMMGRDATSKFPNTPVGRSLGALANQVGYANLKAMLEDPAVGPQILQSLEQQPQVDPAQYGINNSAYARYK
jgi:hypothetical protein